jgi:hypothetical protein
LKSLYKEELDNISNINPGLQQQKVSLQMDDVDIQILQSLKSLYMPTTDENLISEINPILKAQQNIKAQLAQKYGLQTRQPTMQHNEDNHGYKYRLNSLTRALVNAATRSKNIHQKNEKNWKDQLDTIAEIPPTITKDEIIQRINILKEKLEYLEVVLKEISEGSSIHNPSTLQRLFGT